MDIERRNTDNEAKYLARIAEQRALIERLMIDPVYGCYTKPGFLLALEAIQLDGLYVVYFDIDNFKAFNNEHGKAHANVIIRNAIKPRGYDILGNASAVGRWFSGDELAGIFPASDAFGYCKRVQAALHGANSSATFVILPILHKGTPQATIDYAEKLVSLLKSKDFKNIIVKIGD